MGYTTEFAGSFSITPTLKPEHKEFLDKLKNTRRMVRSVDESKYGIDGEFYVDGKKDEDSFFDSGKLAKTNILEFNKPPVTQCSLWLQWQVTDDGDELEWDGGEKAYNMDDWIVYLVERFFRPLGYVLSGEVLAQGEDMTDRWKMTIKKNEIKFTGSIKGDGGQAALREVLTCDLGQLPTHLQVHGATDVLSIFAQRRMKGASWMLHPWGNDSCEVVAKPKGAKEAKLEVKIDARNLKKLIKDHPLKETSGDLLQDNKELCLAFLTLIKEAPHA
jgi:hypothetical protein